MQSTQSPLLCSGVGALIFYRCSRSVETDDALVIALNESRGLMRLTSLRLTHLETFPQPNDDVELQHVLPQAWGDDRVARAVQHC